MFRWTHQYYTLMNWRKPINQIDENESLSNGFKFYRRIHHWRIGQIILCSIIIANQNHLPDLHAKSVNHVTLILWVISPWEQKICLGSKKLVQSNTWLAFASDQQHSHVNGSKLEMTVSLYLITTHL